jgi:hypothetical protein
VPGRHNHKGSKGKCKEGQSKQAGGLKQACGYVMQEEGEWVQKVEDVKVSHHTSVSAIAFH